jgi:hypothetical protein
VINFLSNLAIGSHAPPSWARDLPGRIPEIPHSRKQIRKAAFSLASQFTLASQFNRARSEKKNQSRSPPPFFSKLPRRRRRRRVQE